MFTPRPYHSPCSSFLNSNPANPNFQTQADDLTLEKLPPLGQLTHIRDAARKMFVDRPKVEARIEVLKREVRGESSADKEWRKGEEERMERVMKAREAALAEKKMYGEGENGAWWEND